MHKLRWDGNRANSCGSAVSLQPGGIEARISGERHLYLSRTSNETSKYKTRGRDTPTEREKREKTHLSTLRDFNVDISSQQTSSSCSEAEVSQGRAEKEGKRAKG